VDYFLSSENVFLLFSDRHHGRLLVFDLVVIDKPVDHLAKKLLDHSNQHRVIRRKHTLDVIAQSDLDDVDRYLLWAMG
jgi:hypothetical protein